jgi:murein DD-endopeptidase MepM/ murein hydrolase activator NlpD
MISESDTIGWPALGIDREDPEVGRALGPGFCTGPITGTAGSGTLVWPLPDDTASRDHVFLSQDFGPAHSAIDVAAPPGTPILAVDGGVVLYAGWTDNGGGFAVILDHGDGWQTFYAHLETVAAHCGASIAQGEALGTVGSTGRSTGPHLHFAIYSSREGLVNPLDLLPPMPAAEEP